MSAIERLDAIEREIQFAMMPLGARVGAKSMTAALRAVLALHASVSRGRVEDCCSTCCSDEECVSINDCGIHAEIEAAITAALDVTS